MKMDPDPLALWQAITHENGLSPSKLKTEHNLIFVHYGSGFPPCASSSLPDHSVDCSVAQCEPILRVLQEAFMDKHLTELRIYDVNQGLVVVSSGFINTPLRHTKRVGAAQIVRLVGQ